MHPVAKCEHASGAFKEVMRGFKSERSLIAALDGGEIWISRSETFSCSFGSESFGSVLGLVVGKYWTGLFKHVLDNVSNLASFEIGARRNDPNVISW